MKCDTRACPGPGPTIRPSRTLVRVVHAARASRVQQSERRSARAACPAGRRPKVACGTFVRPPPRRRARHSRSRPCPVPPPQGLQASAKESGSGQARGGGDQRLFFSIARLPRGRDPAVGGCVATAAHRTRQRWLIGVIATKHFESVGDPRVAAFAASRPGVRTAVGTRVIERGAGHSDHGTAGSVVPSRLARRS